MELKGKTTLAEDTDALLKPAFHAGFDSLICGFGDQHNEAPRGAITVTQVHGARLVAGDALTPGAHEIEADGLTLVVDGAAVGIRTADCVPILMAGRTGERRWAAAVHAGWRGTIAGIANEAVEAALRAGIKVEDVRVALGPSIGPCCYEVDADLAARFADEGLPVEEAGSIEGSVKPHLDLRAINSWLLEHRSGLARSAIEYCGPCTRCQSDRYHSYRAAGASAGRQLSWIGWADRRPPTDH